MELSMKNLQLISENENKIVFLLKQKHDRMMKIPVKETLNLTVTAQLHDYSFSFEDYDVLKYFRH